MLRVVFHPGLEHHDKAFNAQTIDYSMEQGFIAVFSFFPKLSDPSKK